MICGHKMMSQLSQHSQPNGPIWDNKHSTMHKIILERVLISYMWNTHLLVTNKQWYTRELECITTKRHANTVPKCNSQQMALASTVDAMWDIINLISIWDGSKMSPICALYTWVHTNNIIWQHKYSPKILFEIQQNIST